MIWLWLYPFTAVVGLVFVWLAINLDTDLETR